MVGQRFSVDVSTVLSVVTIVTVLKNNGYLSPLQFISV